MISTLRIAAALLLLTTVAVAQDAKAPVLELVREAKCSDVFETPGAYDTSGVTFVKGKLYVVFDTRKSLGIVGLKLEKGKLSEGSPAYSDYEGVSYDKKRKCFYVVVESMKGATGYNGALVELDKDLKTTARWILEPQVGGPSKGLEGVLAVRRGKREFVLALLESNHGVAKMDPRAQERGNGRIRVYERGSADGETTWTLVTTVKLPTLANFEDYAGLDLRGNRLVVVSQSTRRVWIGRLDPKKWAIAGPGKVYRFPKSDEGRYGNVEGVAWVSDTELAMVSDGAKGKVKNLAKAESLHIFKIPR